MAGETNVQGEDQKKLDVISNDVFCAALRESGRTAVIASEEEDVPVAVEETSLKAQRAARQAAGQRPLRAFKRFRWRAAAGGGVAASGGNIIIISIIINIMK